jgi:hypothetical protein
VQFAAAWRSYPSPPSDQVQCADRATTRALQTANLSEQSRKRSFEAQVDRARATGFPGPMSEVGHGVVWELRRLGFSRSVANYGGHLASVSSEWNYQGNRRLSRWIGFSDRTARRARAALEARKLIKSHLLLTGEQLVGQKAPVRHPQVVRHVAALQRLAHVRGSIGLPKRKGRAAANAEAPRAPSVAETESPSADDFDAMALRHPEFAGPLGVLAAARRKGAAKPPVVEQQPVPPAPSPEEIDRWEAETARLERELQRGVELGLFERIDPAKPPE